MIDERTEEAAALFALDLLEGDERVAFLAQLAQDAELRQLVDALRATTDQLALSAPPARPSAFLRERLLMTVSALPFAPTTHQPEALLAERASTGRKRGPRLLPFSLPAAAGWAAAASFALAAGYFAVKSYNVRSEYLLISENERMTAIEARALLNQLDAERILSRSQIDQLKTAEQRLAETETMVARLVKEADLAQLKISSLASLAGTPEAQAIAVWNPSRQEGVLTVSKLPALAQDKDYQLWVVDPQYATPVDGGVFQVDATSGTARITFKPDRPVATVAKFAVSLERKGGVPVAEGKMVLLSF